MYTRYNSRFGQQFTYLRDLLIKVSINLMTRNYLRHQGKCLDSNYPYLHNALSTARLRNAP